ncbi:MAG: hypothetical protein A2015_14705 [Spirochaetes bacterium GWF1_31_7]|nr:MAG: hypothetical protein A2Y30_10390 [Spirochaetes bacterium GWE1_32_154]OHD47086.1 MAG: hypothetical protein A2Y29_02165 [Spirochaetes bacterium GWE2_31_10]OHD51729.1 MAG: hypothetical protein A2015_14705 [Spirochaetes bacterium GWF1_31_7]OHD72866.1 MAG: hypothetical protein A2355_10960 [Spirochaetes bacterium RIFOXYB1_FULL_32_8]HBD92681.1 hypothetical protein [Spirochaetia bacterium]
MRKKIFYSINFVITFLLLSCSNEIDPSKPLPSFEGINVDKNTIFVLDRDDVRYHYIYAIDTVKNKIFYSYKFDGIFLGSIVYNYSFDIDGLYVNFIDGRVVRICLSEGKVGEFNIDSNVECIGIFDGKLFLTPCKPGLKNVPVVYSTYDPIRHIFSSVTLPEGIFYPTSYYTSNNGSLLISLSFYGEPPELYDFTNNFIIDSFELTKTFNFIGGYQLRENYLLGLYEEKENTYNIAIYTLNYDNGICQFDYKFSHIEDFMFFDFLIIDHWMYLIGRTKIVIRDINNNYNIVNQIKLIDGGENSVYYLNNFFWIPSQQYNGVYKINPDDLSVEVIR